MFALFHYVMDNAALQVLVAEDNFGAVISADCHLGCFAPKKLRFLYDGISTGQCREACHCSQSRKHPKVFVYKNINLHPPPPTTNTGRGDLWLFMPDEHKPRYLL